MDSQDSSSLKFPPVALDNVQAESFSDADGQADMPRVRAEVLRMLREKRYEDALRVLFWARSKLPESTELQRSVEQVKELLVGAYAKRLGGLDKIAEPLVTKPKRSPDFLLVSRYIDGTSTFGDLAQICPLGRIRTLQVLVELYSPADPSREPRSGSRSLDPDDKAGSGIEPAPITRRSNSSTPPGNGAVAAQADSSSLGSSRPVVGAPSSRSFQSDPGVDSQYRVALPGEAHPFADDVDGQFREAFERGTKAFVQKRFDEAVAAFQRATELRPDHPSAAVMLRNSQRELELS